MSESDVNIGRQAWNEAAKKLGFKGDLDELREAMLSTCVVLWKPVMRPSTADDRGAARLFRRTLRDRLHDEISDEAIETLLAMLPRCAATARTSPGTAAKTAARAGTAASAIDAASKPVPGRLVPSPKESRPSSAGTCPRRPARAGLLSPTCQNGATQATALGKESGRPHGGRRRCGEARAAADRGNRPALKRFVRMTLQG
jgi:hypothetical protein